MKLRNYKELNDSRKIPSLISEKSNEPSKKPESTYSTERSAKGSLKAEWGHLSPRAPVSVKTSIETFEFSEPRLALTARSNIVSPRESRFHLSSNKDYTNRLTQKLRDQAKSLHQLQEFKIHAQQKIQELTASQSSPFKTHHFSYDVRNRDLMTERNLETTQQRLQKAKRIEEKYNPDLNAILRNKNEFDSLATRKIVSPVLVGKKKRMKDENKTLRTHEEEREKIETHNESEVSELGDKQLLENMLKEESLDNQRQRNYIKILQNSLDAKLEDYGIESKPSFDRAKFIQNLMKQKSNVDYYHGRISELSNECYLKDKKINELERKLQEFTISQSSIKNQFQSSIYELDTIGKDVKRLEKEKTEHLDYIKKIENNEKHKNDLLNSHSIQMSNLENEKNHLEKQLKKCQEIINTKNERIEGLEEANLNFTRKINKQTDDLKFLNEKSSDFHIISQKKKEEMEKLNILLQNSYKVIEQQRVVMTNNQEKLSANETLLEKLTQKSDHFQKQNIAMKTDIEKRQREKIKLEEEKIAHFKEFNSKFEITNAALDSELNSFERKLDKLQSQLQSAQKENKQKTQDLEYAQRMITKKNSEILEFTENLDRSREENITMKQELKNVKKLQDINIYTLKTLESEKEEKNEEKGFIERDNEKLQKDVIDLQTQLRKNEGEIKELNRLNHGIKREKKELQNQIQNLTTNIEQNQRFLNNSTAMKDAYIVQIEQQKKAISGYKVQLKMADKESKNLIKELDKYRELLTKKMAPNTQIEQLSNLLHNNFLSKKKCRIINKNGRKLERKEKVEFLETNFQRFAEKAENLQNILNDFEKIQKGQEHVLNEKTISFSQASSLLKGKTEELTEKTKEIDQFAKALTKERLKAKKQEIELDSREEEIGRLRKDLKEITEDIDRNKIDLSKYQQMKHEFDKKKDEKLKADVFYQKETERLNCEMRKFRVTNEELEKKTVDLNNTQKLHEEDSEKMKKELLELKQKEEDKVLSKDILTTKMKEMERERREKERSISDLKKDIRFLQEDHLKEKEKLQAKLKRKNSDIGTKSIELNSYKEILSREREEKVDLIQENIKFQGQNASLKKEFHTKRENEDKQKRMTGAAHERQLKDMLVKSIFKLGEDTRYSIT